jgi:hypothetical protein
MASIKLTGDTSGEITISAPAVAGTNTLTLPANTATVGIVGGVFSAFVDTAQTITNNSTTKVTLDGENFDPESEFDSTTNYRYTPSVSGYYQVNFGVRLNPGVSINANNQLQSFIYKNGASICRSSNRQDNTGASMSASGSEIVFLNGSTDYIELYVYQSTGVSCTTTDTANGGTYLSAVFIRS